MDVAELRAKFLDFFEGKGHTIVESAPLVPGNDPTLLFTNSGMVQFKEAFAFREDRGYTRAATCQRCIRAGGKHNDLDNVGYTARHHTFFEMLGNFSFGDYFKEETISFAWEFLTEVINLPPERLWVTVHSSDDEAEQIWLEKIGFDPHRITRLGDEDNFWTMGDTGPCGPSSEIFWDHGPDVPGGPPGSPDGGLDRYIEIWNLVFTQYDRSADGILTPLPKKCVDTGMGLERLAAILQAVHSNYDIDLFRVLTAKAGTLLGQENLENPSLKVISDHIRSAVFLISDGVIPSNEGRGYVLRRIIRRALRHGHKLKASAPFFYKLVTDVVAEMSDSYPLIRQTQGQTERILLKEEKQFQLTLDQGMNILNHAISVMDGEVITGELVFKLYDTYGFPADLTADVARERDLSIDLDGFEHEMSLQRNRARATSQFDVFEVDDLELEVNTDFFGYETLEVTASVLAIIQEGSVVDSISAGNEALLMLDSTPFYAESGGQVGDQGVIRSETAVFNVTDTVKKGESWLHRGVVLEGLISSGDLVSAAVEESTRNAIRLNHSATHLLHSALRLVLGEHVNQRGSSVDSEKLRFDFSHFEPLTKLEQRKIESLVNQEIRRNTLIQTELMDINSAKARGAMALFGEKYSEEVRVLTMGEGFSIELCGGTHAARTGDIGVFRIVSEQGIASGVRRIEALTGEGALKAVESMDALLDEFSGLLKSDKDSLVDKIRTLLQQNKELEKHVADLNTKLASGSQDLVESALDLGDFKLLVTLLEDVDPKSFPDALDRLKNKLGSGIVVLGTVKDGKVALIAGVTKNLTDRFNAGDVVNFVATQVGGKGGGRPDMARAGGSDGAALPRALETVETYVRNQL